MKSKFSLLNMLVAVVICATIFAVWIYLGRGVDVTIRNADASAIRRVEVHVTGRSYDLGEIAPNAQKRVGVRPIGESHLEISYVDADDTKRRLVVDCYFESGGYNGTLEVDISGGKVVRQTDRIRPRLY